MDKQPEGTFACVAPECRQELQDGADLLFANYLGAMGRWTCGATFGCDVPVQRISNLPLKLYRESELYAAYTERRAAMPEEKRNKLPV